MRGNPIRFQIRIQLDFNFAPRVPSSIRLDTTFLHSVCIWRLPVHGTHVNSSDPLNARLKKKRAAFFLEHIVSIKKILHACIVHHHPSNNNGRGSQQHSAEERC